jgi:NAD(P)-dependent dehydrogenase (short-subunit alcohol dehydrogenase family)
MSGLTFANTVVAITGAAGGIGRELCRYFAGEGAAIAAFDKSDRLSGFAAELRATGTRVESVIVNIVDTAAVADAFNHAASALGPIDVLINNAGITTHPTIEGTPPDGFVEELYVNLIGAYACTYAVIPSMKARRRGSIVNIGSVNGLMALGDAGYSAAKAGLISLTRSLAQELGRYNIRANIVCPGTVRTPIWDERASRNPDVLTQLARWYPLGRIVEPIEVMRAVAFLASDAASAITGVVLPVDCGLSAGNIVMAKELTVGDI